MAFIAYLVEVSTCKQFPQEHRQLVKAILDDISEDMANDPSHFTTERFEKHKLVLKRVLDNRSIDSDNPHLVHNSQGKVKTDDVCSFPNEKRDTRPDRSPAREQRRYTRENRGRGGG